MSNELRICHAENFHIFLQFYNNGKYDGLAKSFIDLLMDTLMTGARNLTLKFITNQGFGTRISPNSEEYNGCLGRLQKNQSDMLFVLSNYPVEIINISQGIIVSESGITLLPFYYEKPRLTHQISGSFYSFSLLIWLCIFGSLGTIWLLLMFRTKLINKIRYEISIILHRNSYLKLIYPIKRRKKSSKNLHYLYRVLVHFSRLGSIQSTTLFQKILFITLSIKCLVLLHYFCTLIKTELVVVPEPEIYRNYDEIMKHNVSPLFYHGFNDENYFTSAHINSPEYKFWKYANKVYNTTTIQQNIRDMKIYPGTVDVTKYFDDVMERKRVIFIDSLFAPTCQKLLCRFQSRDQQAMMQFLGPFDLRLKKRNATSLPPYNINRYTMESSRVLKTAIFSSKIQQHLHAICKRALVRVFENGIFMKIESLVIRQDPFGHILGKDLPSRLERLRECIGDTSSKGEPQHHPLQFILMNNFIIYCFSSFGFSFVLLLIEICVSTLLPSKKSKLVTTKSRERRTYMYI